MAEKNGVAPPTEKPRLFTGRDALLLLIGFASVLALWPARKVVAENEINLFFGWAAVQALLCLAGAALIWNGPTSRARIWIVVAIAVLLHASLTGEKPKLSDDVYRYIWDGKVQAAGINPYRYIPADPKLAFLRDRKIYPNINRRDYAPTIYPPGAQMFFFAVTRVSRSIVWFKCVLFLLQMLTLWLLGQLLTSFGLPRERILIYGWNPLVLWEFCSGHIDVLMTTLVVLALLLRRKERNVLTGCVLGSAALVKFFPLVLLPALWHRRDWKMPAAVFATIALGYIPYLSVGHRVFGFLAGYAGEEGLDDGRFFLPLLLRFLSGGALEIHPLIYLLPGACALLLLGLWITRSEKDFIPRAAILGGCFLFVLSPQYPWYWIWVTPLLAFARGRMLLPLFWVSAGALCQYGAWSDEVRLGLNLSLVRDFLQYLPALALWWAMHVIFPARQKYPFSWRIPQLPAPVPTRSR